MNEIKGLSLLVLKGGDLGKHSILVGHFLFVTFDFSFRKDIPMCMWQNIVMLQWISLVSCRKPLVSFLHSSNEVAVFMSCLKFMERRISEIAVSSCHLEKDTFLGYAVASALLVLAMSQTSKLK